ncbi:toxin YdaT family protein [Vibrio sp. Isolate24]|uniref:toxin YdaT family protein n=1 Tax=Vibrio sp. Isolate24 TaxID=2908534 RepID=UPI001EFE3958|nr:toxin YdaT family protein [Vibrio sp. Isolate24]MCG9678726.1 hypothetical protein [Vibrio sp. Isolate24]
MILSLKSVTRNAIEGWRTEVSKEYIANRIASMYHRFNLKFEVDAQRKELLKVPGTDDKNNAQNFFRYNERTSIEAKATILDLLPAIIMALPVDRACDMLNKFFNPLGFSVVKIGASHSSQTRDQLLTEHSKETSEAFRAVISLGENANIDQIRDAYREVHEAKESHEPILEYLETLITKKAA